MVNTPPTARAGDDQVVAGGYEVVLDGSGIPDDQDGGFTVFVRVIEGMEIVDAMAGVAIDGETPVDDLLLETATIE